jgi:hypothetical protein
VDFNLGLLGNHIEQGQRGLFIFDGHPGDYWHMNIDNPPLLSSLEVTTWIAEPHIQPGVKSTQSLTVDRNTGTQLHMYKTGSTNLGLASVGADKAEFHGGIDSRTGIIEMSGETGSWLAPGDWFGPLDMDIDYDFRFRFDPVTGSISLFGGTHDGFPSYKIEANGNVIYYRPQKSLLELIGCCDVTVP